MYGLYAISFFAENGLNEVYFSLYPSSCLHYSHARLVRDPRGAALSIQSTKNYTHTPLPCLFLGMRYFICNFLGPAPCVGVGASCWITQPDEKWLD